MPPLVAEDMYGRGVVGRLLDLLDFPPLLTWKQLMTPLSVSVCVWHNPAAENGHLEDCLPMWVTGAVQQPVFLLNGSKRSAQAAVPGKLA